MDKIKYSLWIVPDQKEITVLQDTVDAIADKYNTPHFVPHTTLVANIFIRTLNELPELKDTVQRFATSATSFDLNLQNYGTLDEEYRSLFLTAENTSDVQQLYEQATEFFPQVEDEHFAAMPHMSLMYSTFTHADKQKIIEAFPIHDITFSVSALELWLTNGEPSGWRREQRFQFGD